MFDPTLGFNEPQTLALQTRKGGLIANSMNSAEPYIGIQLQIEDLKLRHPNATHRKVGPSARYNCHGLTFGARRTGITDPTQIQRILRDDGYRELSQLEEAPEAGDIVIYQEDGDIIHSGLVVGTRQQIPWVLGKWGECHEVVHAVRDCPYGAAAVLYYRLMK